MLRTKLPRILSLKHAKNPRHGIEIYSNVLSRSRGTRIVHLVTRDKKRFFCSCEDKSFNPAVRCIHIQSVQKRLDSRRKAAVL